MPHRSISSLKAPEPVTLIQAFSLCLRHLPLLAPLAMLLALLFRGLVWWLTGFGNGHDPLMLEASHPLRLGEIAPLCLQFALLGFGLLISFVLLSTALRQVTRRDRLTPNRLLRTLESELLPMLRYAGYIVRRRFYLFLLCLVPLIATGMSPVGGLGLVFDLGREPNIALQLTNLLIVLLSAIILYALLPYLLAAYQVLFHETTPAEAEAAVRHALKGRCPRIAGGLLLAALPYYLADECLFYTEWHPVLRHAIGAVFALPFLNTAYLFYTRIEATILHPRIDLSAPPPAGYHAPR